MANGVTPNENAKMKHIFNKEFNTDMMVGNKRHWCPDNGYGAIDDTMSEFDNCRCNMSGFE